MPNYILLERIELNASAASVTFSNIPQTGYTDLKVVASARSDYAGVQASLYISPNGLTTNGSSRVLFGSGSTAASYTYTNINMRDIAANTSTASTFGNTEVYIPNYNSTTTYKSFSADSVGENNATAAPAGLSAGLWSSNSAITSLQLSTDGNFMQYSTFSLYGLAAVGTTPVIAPKASGGNRIDYDGTYWIHTFNTSGTFTPQTGLTCDYLVVAGGGGGGIAGNARGGGGGGAGGYRTATSQSLSVTSYTVTVGAGGAGSTNSVNRGVSGNTSSFNSTSTTAGGGGGSTDNTGVINGLSGGSGGGGANFNGTTASGGAGNAGSYSPVEGYAGGAGFSSISGANGGGGGGSASVGTAGGGTGSIGGAGGTGTANSISGSSVTYAVGGAGGGTTSASVGASGTVNTGNGGQGNANNYAGGAGGSGIVIIRYLAA